MSDYTITIKRCSEVYSKDEVLKWFKQYEMTNYLTAEQTNHLLKYWNKEILANMIFDHYYLREIAFETPEMFKHYTKVKLQEIMYKYLPLLYSSSLKFNPLEDDKTFYMKETYKGNKDKENKGDHNQLRSSTMEGSSDGTSTTNGTSSSTSDSKTSSLQINNDTPQGQISKENILEGKYASSVSANESEGEIKDSTNSNSSNKLINSETRKNNESTSNSEITTGTENENYELEKSGFDLKMTNSEKILEYRKTIENYNLQIIEELNPLFFALY